MTTGKRLVLLCLACLLLVLPSPAENFGDTPQADIARKTYLPGDLVHLVVGAPSNVVQVIAEAPDGQKLTLDFERRTHIWHGLWEVPYGFKKGNYSARLIATDVEGKVFEGKTSSFYVGEPTLVTLIGLELTQETKRRPSVPATTALPAVKPAEPARAPQPPAAAVTATAAPKSKKPRAVKPSFSRREAAKLKAELEKEKLNLKFKLFTMARVHLTTQQFDQTVADLKELLKLDPHNTEYQAMLKRVAKIAQAKGAGL